MSNSSPRRRPFNSVQDWVSDYRATRPKVERKIGHLMRRKHGGRRARVRGQVKAAADFALLAAAVNLARLAVLAVASVARIGVGHRSRVNRRGGEPRLPCPAVELGARERQEGPTDFVRSTQPYPRQRTGCRP